MSITTHTLLATAALTLVGPLALGAPAQAGGTPQCPSKDLAVGYVHSGSAAGSTYSRIRLTNVSGHVCRTGGYPGLSYVGDGNGTQIGRAAIRTDSGEVVSYILRPGQRLVGRLQEVRAQNYPRARCGPAAVDGLRVYVPNSRSATYVAHATTGCRNHAVHLMYLQPLKRP